MAIKPPAAKTKAIPFTKIPIGPAPTYPKESAANYNQRIFDKDRDLRKKPG